MAFAGRANRIGDDDRNRGFGEIFAEMFELKVRGRRSVRTVVDERLKRPRGRLAMVEEMVAPEALYMCELAVFD